MSQGNLGHLFCGLYLKRLEYATYVRRMSCRFAVSYDQAHGLADYRQVTNMGRRLDSPDSAARELHRVNLLLALGVTLRIPLHTLQKLDVNLMS